MRTKNAMRTFLYGIFFTTIIAILGLIKTKVLLMYLGSEYVGVYQLFSQMYIYLSLVDGGIGASIAFHLYKPVHEDDKDKINQIVAGAKYYFYKVGIIVIILGFILSFGIMFFIKDTSISSYYVKICFILFILSSSCSYFTSAYAILYDSEQKLYKSSNLNHLLSISESIAAIVISFLGGKLLTILLVFLGLSILKNVYFVCQARREHEYLENTNERDLSFKKEANNLIVNKISTLIFENVDIIIVSKFLGLIDVFIYTAYNQIISMLTQMIQRLNSALIPSIGNLLITEKGKARNTFYELNSLLFYIGSILFVPLYYMLSPFVKIWYGSKYVVSDVVCLFFVIILYINILKIVLDTYIKASGDFKSVRNSSIYQSIINIFLSLFLVNKFGIGGILFATIFAFITGNFIHYPRIIYKKIIDDKVFNYYKKVLKYLFGLIFNICICYFVNQYIAIDSIIFWIIKGIIIFVINFVLTTIFYIFVKEFSFYERIRQVLRQRMGKKNA